MNAKALGDLASQLALHVAAMKPNYLFEAEVPQEVKEKVIAEEEKDKKKALEKFLAREVMMEQELATSDEPLKIRDLIAAKEKEGLGRLTLREWALFNIGA